MEEKRSNIFDIIFSYIILITIIIWAFLSKNIYVTIRIFLGAVSFIICITFAFLFLKK